MKKEQCCGNDAVYR